MFDIPRWSMIDNPYYYEYKGSDKLLITVGDSWTYGDSLGKTKVRNGIDDTEYRLSHVYGKLLANELSCSWINLALPGCSNEWMLNSLEKLLPNVQEKNVICVITLTESGRHEELQLINRSLPTQQAVLETILLHTYNRIRKIQAKYPNVYFITGHNFTDRGENPVNMLSYNWLDVMYCAKVSSVQNKTHIVVSDHIRQMNYEHRFADVLEIIEKAEQRVRLLESCEHCNKEDTKHPTEFGHAMWAGYILPYLC